MFATSDYMFLANTVSSVFAKTNAFM